MKTPFNTGFLDSTTQTQAAMCESSPIQHHAINKSIGLIIEMLPSDQCKNSGQLGRRMGQDMYSKKKLEKQSG
jgi:hypothetical protein